MKMNSQAKRLRRKLHIRKNVSGTAEKPRVFVYKSNYYITSGVVNDVDQKVLFSARVKKGIKNMDELGKKISDMMKKSKVENAVFDRSGYKFHGSIAKYVEALRANGIKI